MIRERAVEWWRHTQLYHTAQIIKVSLNGEKGDAEHEKEARCCSEKSPDSPSARS